MSAGQWRIPPADDDRPTYLAHALANSALHGPGPWPNGGYPLPDENPGRRRPLMSGAVHDGVRTQHGGVDPDATAAATLARLVHDLVTGPSTVDALRLGVARLHDAAAEQDALAIADALTGELRGRDLPDGRLREVGRWLAEYGTRRNAVAVGILLLGRSGDQRDRDLLILLGCLEELSLYAVVALARSQPDRQQAIFSLARRVDGWGRIHAVRRLAGSHDPQIKGWLLRQGFRNRILDDYLAHLAATTGDLYSALTTPPVDDELLDGAGDILTTLCLIGGPAEDITDYPEAPQAIERYLALVADRPPSLARVAAVLRLSRFLERDAAIEVDWTEATRARLRRTCDGLVERPDWLRTVDAAMDGRDLSEFRLAIWPASRLGIPTRTRVRTRLRAHPLDAYLWQTLADDIDDVLVLAQELLPLDRLTGEPTRDIGLGADRPDHILDLIVGRLSAHPGKGWPLIRVALANPTIRNRNMAIRALGAWPPDTVPGDAVAALRRASEIEPDPDVRDRMRGLLATWPGGGGH